jgi:mono/diheme cytochrome c family protein
MLGEFTVRQCLALVLVCLGSSAFAGQPSDGKALLESNCGRCHAVEPGAQSPRENAPNLSIILQAYPADRLEVELTEGIRPKHPDMPQVRFSPSEIASIYYYLHGKAPESEYRHSQ